MDLRKASVYTFFVTATVDVEVNEEEEKKKEKSLDCFFSFHFPRMLSFSTRFHLHFFLIILLLRNDDAIAAIVAKVAAVVLCGDFIFIYMIV